jgi:hypothetical protein
MTIGTSTNLKGTFIIESAHLNHWLNNLDKDIQKKLAVIAATPK